MVDSIFEFLSSALSGNVYTALFASFGWGIISVLLSPCHLSSIPLVVGFINSQGEMYDKTSLGFNFHIASYLKSPAGRTALAKSMVQPIRNNINYVGIAQYI